MSLAQTLADFQTAAIQCDALVANAHRLDATGVHVLPPLDRQQIVVAAFLNLFVSWEAFLEDALAKYMTGVPSRAGRLPVRYVNPSSEADARRMIIGVNRYFDYANHENVRKIVKICFQGGGPFEPHLSGVDGKLKDMRTMRNASAHISSTTQAALESLAQRVFGTPRPGIALSTMLTSVDPNSASGGTVFSECRDTLLAAAQLIASG